MPGGRGLDEVAARGAVGGDLARPRLHGVSPTIAAAVGESPAGQRERLHRRYSSAENLPATAERCQDEPRQATNVTQSALEAPRSARSCQDRKSTRLNSSHVAISYAAFCLKKT